MSTTLRFTGCEVHSAEALGLERREALRSRTGRIGLHGRVGSADSRTVNVTTGAGHVVKVLDPKVLRIRRGRGSGAGGGGRKDGSTRPWGVRAQALRSAAPPAHLGYTWLCQCSSA